MTRQPNRQVALDSEPWFDSLREAADEVVREFDALVNARVAEVGVALETERLCAFRETYIQRLRVAIAMAGRRQKEPV